MFFQVYLENDWIVSGGCPQGADRFAEVIAKKHGLPILIFYHNWDRFGKSAGFERNTRIAEYSKTLIARVTPDRKGGTEDTIKKFQKLDGTRILYLIHDDNVEKLIVSGGATWQEPTTF